MEPDLIAGEGDHRTNGNGVHRDFSPMVFYFREKSDYIRPDPIPHST